MQDCRRSSDQDGHNDERRTSTSQDQRASRKRSLDQHEIRHDSHRSSNHRDYSDGRPSSTIASSQPQIVKTMNSSRSQNATTSLRSPPTTSTAVTMHHEGAVDSPLYKEPQVRSLIDALCDKMWWLVQCEQERKKERKLCADLERCQPLSAESAHYSDLLKQQIEQCQKVKKKCADRMSLDDDKIMTNLAILLEKHAQRNQPQRIATPTGTQKEDLDTRLQDFSETLHRSLNQRFQKTTAKLSASSQSLLQKETDELKKSLEIERQRNDRLEKKLEEMEQKFGSLSERQNLLIQQTLETREMASGMIGDDKAATSGNLKQVFQKLDLLSLNSATKRDLDTAMERFEDEIITAVESTAEGAQKGLAMRVGSKTGQHIRRLSAALDSVIKSGFVDDAGSTVVTTIQQLQSQIRSCDRLIQEQSKHTAKLSESLKSLEDSVKEISSMRSNVLNSPALVPPGSASAASATAMFNSEDSDANVAKRREDIKSMVEAKLSSVAKELGSLIDNGTPERQISPGQMEESRAQLSSLREDLVQLREYTRASISRLDEVTIRHDAQLLLHKDAVTAFDLRLQQIAGENTSVTEELALQLRVVNHWQSNFTTKQLYRDIVDHITRTLPTGTFKQLSILGSRLDTVESQLRTSEGITKKRKLPS